MRKFVSGLVLVGGMALSATSGASVIDGKIHNIDGDMDGLADDLKVARVMFTVSAGTRVFFDSLVRETGGIDLNGDGVITGFDNFMALFKGTDFLTSNDDSGTTYSDGSRHVYDSTLTYTFAEAGTYMISLGQLGYSPTDALRGYKANDIYEPYDGNQNWGAWRLTMTATGGTLSDVAEEGAVPEPASLLLLGGGLLGLATSRRKTTQRI